MIDLRTCFIFPLTRITPDLLDTVFTDLVKDESEFIENLVRSQLSQGVDGSGNLITPPYSPYTVAVKRAEGREADFVTLYDTGSLYDDIFVQVFDNAFSQNSSDSKVPELKAKYGDDIFDLTEDSKTILFAYLKPKFIVRLKTAIGL